MWNGLPNEVVSVQISVGLCIKFYVNPSRSPSTRLKVGGIVSTFQDSLSNAFRRIGEEHRYSWKAKVSDFKKYRASISSPT